VAEMEDNNLVAEILEDNNMLKIQDGEMSGKREKRSPQIKGKGGKGKKRKGCKKGKAGRRCRSKLNEH
jgi:hypothetical protein